MVDCATALRRYDATAVGRDDSTSGRRWVLWQDLTPRDGAHNMAIDLALLQRAARDRECWLRLYTWRPYCLSFGRNEPAERRYNRVKIRQAGLAVVRRPTGGRAVWHARELTYACVRERNRGVDATQLITMAKIFCARVARFVADECIQLSGGYGYMKESAAGRAFVDSRLISIGGGSDETMLHYLAKQLGF